jgi:phosphohistidine phosphatase SixA
MCLGRRHLLLTFLAASACTMGRSDAAHEPSTAVYLVRHAERADDGTPDPPLSEAGRRRAEQLVHVLADAKLTAVYSTDFQRTRQTAQPLAAALGLEVTSYDPAQLDAFAAQLAQASGPVLVVGHSNTTPDLVTLLGGDPISPIPEDEFDRLYVVFVGGTGATPSALIRFGEPSTATMGR